MRAVLDTERCRLFHGDGADLSAVCDENSIDSIVTDPPAGIGFMGKAWDGDKGGRDQWIAWLADLMRPAISALKPGGHALVWALPRTSHWTAMALEFAGFEIRDVHHHLFGTGFPKSLTSKSAEIPEGTGTALKPAAEHWILARRPILDTISATFAEHRTGLLNIEACRIGTSDDLNGGAYSDGRAPRRLEPGGDAKGCAQPSGPFRQPSGRWPANLSLEHAETCATEGCVIGCPVRALDERSGISEEKPRTMRRTGARHDGSESWRTVNQSFGKVHSGKGGASRFFYVAKGSRFEKDAGLAHLAPRTGGEATGRVDDSAGVANPRAGAGRTGGARNHHPTVKSVDLMRWLVRLITPPGGVVLDMFAGSGTTGVAALAEGCRFIGVELADEYIPIVKGRLRHALGLETEGAA